METVRNMDRAPLGHPGLEAAPEVEAVAIMIADKSRGPDEKNTPPMPRSGRERPGLQNGS